MASGSSSNPPPIRIKSTSNSDFEFEIDYFKLKDIPTGTRIISSAFTTGGFDWVINFYPQGKRQSQSSYVAFFLCLHSEAKNVVVKHSFEVLPKIQNSASVKTIRFKDTVKIFEGCNRGWGYAKFIAREKIEELYCENGVLVVSSSIKVLTEQKVAVNCPDGLSEHIEKLWEKGEKFDVTFEVEGESISAYRLILAARSAVFEAKLFGSMEEAKMERIKIDEMKAEVFKALLHFIYTDQLSETLSVELLQDLLVAADRYALGKLIVLCEEQLEKNLSVDIVATILVLADRHNRTSLKKKCLDFASSPEIFSLVALRDEYLQIRLEFPSLFSELSEAVKDSSPLLIWKKMKNFLISVDSHEMV